MKQKAIFKLFAVSVLGILFPFLANGKTNFSTWELDLGLGFIINSPQKNSNLINKSSDEIDELISLHQPTKLSYSVAARKTILSTPDSNWLRTLTLGMSNYYTNLQTTGDIYQYKAPWLNNYSYKLGTSIDDLLLELQMKLRPYYRLTPFVVFGTGAGFGAISYNESQHAGITGGQAQLGTHHQMLWAFDLGAGGIYALTDKLGIGLQYFYIVHTSQLKTNLCGNNGCILQPLQTSVNLSELFVSLRYQFG